MGAADEKRFDEKDERHDVEAEIAKETEAEEENHSTGILIMCYISFSNRHTNRIVFTHSLYCTGAICVNICYFVGKE